MQYTAFNPRATIDRVALGANRFCYVLDDALLEPERFADWAFRQPRRIPAG